MQRIYNYTSYFISSLMPFYLLFFILTLLSDNKIMVVINLSLLILSVIFLLFFLGKKPTNIFVCHEKEVISIKKRCNYSFNLLHIIIYSYILFCCSNIYIFSVLYLLLMIISYNAVYYLKNYALLLSGYKMYQVRGKIVYSKMNLDSFREELKANKYIQILEIFDDIYLEKKSYNMKNNLCL